MANCQVLGNAIVSLDYQNHILSCAVSSDNYPSSFELIEINAESTSSKEI